MGLYYLIVCYASIEQSIGGKYIIYNINEGY